MPVAPVKTNAAAPKRRRTPILIGALALVASLLAGGWYMATKGTESTDDAQVEGRVMNVSARITGQVLKVHVEGSQVVDAGDVMIELERADYAAKVDAARADLAAAQAGAARGYNCIFGAWIACPQSAEDS